MQLMTRRIFISSPIKKRLTERQRRISEAIVARIRAEKLIDQVFDVGGIPDRRWTPENCLSVMRKCCGAVLIGFPRWSSFEEGKPIELTTEFLHYEGVLAQAMRLPILTIVEEGVAERGVIKDPLIIPMQKAESWVQTDDFNLGFNEWLREINERHDVFLGYCSKASPVANAVSEHLTKMGLAVRDWKKDFRYGNSIIDEIAAAASDCSCAIFVFSPDDDLVQGTQQIAAPRDNVIFEAGYFMNARGRDRVLIMREGSAKMPADLGGNIYASLQDRNDLSAIEDAVTSFIERAL
jgi:hypothetical protein